MVAKIKQAVDFGMALVQKLPEKTMNQAVGWEYSSANRESGLSVLLFLGSFDQNVHDH